VMQELEMPGKIGRSAPLVPLSEPRAQLLAADITSRADPAIKATVFRVLFIVN